MRGVRGVVGGMLVVAACGSLAACGAERRDAGERAGTYRMAVTDAMFPEEQTISQRQQMRLTVRNTGDRVIPTATMTVATEPSQEGGAAQPFSTDIADPAVADPSRPIWIVDQPPVGAETAVTNTWSLGPLRPGQTKTFEWGLTPVRPGTYTVTYEAGASLTGKASAEGDTGGRFRVTVSDDAPQARVGDDGEVEQLPPDGAN